MHFLLARPSRALMLASLLLPFGVQAQVASLDSSLQHEVILRRMHNAEALLYEEGLQRYATYLAAHPLHVEARIERCAFIGTAMYDAENEYNPNQDDHDSCLAALAVDFPDEPAVFLARAENQWGEEKTAILEEAEHSLNADPTRWSQEDRASVYRELANGFHYQEENKHRAMLYVELLIGISETDRGSYLHASVLRDNDREEEALEALKLRTDTADGAWGLQQRAAMLMELGDHANALRVYRIVETLDSNAVDNGELAHTLAAAGEIAMAREHFVRDTTNGWGKEQAAFALFEHDLEHHGGDTAVASYNAYRDHGFAQDPLAVQRLRLFIHHPLQGWKFRDLGGVLLLLVVIVVLLLLPSIWVLPVHFVGTRWPRFQAPVFGTMRFGLKDLWWVGSAYLLASLASVIVEPSVMQDLFADDYAVQGYDEATEGFLVLIFTVVCAVLTLPVLFRTGLGIYRSPEWSFGRNVGQMLLLFFGFRFIGGLYVRIANALFPADPDPLVGIMQVPICVAQSELLSFESTYGAGISLLMLAVVVPVYEEIMFRGVMLNSCMRYLGFKRANIMQAAFFSAVHGELLLAPYFFLFGIFTGLLTKRSQGLLASTLFHVLNNALAVGLTTLKG